jgi:hypothetical protein
VRRTGDLFTWNPLVLTCRIARLSRNNVFCSRGFRPVTSTSFLPISILLIVLIAFGSANAQDDASESAEEEGAEKSLMSQLKDPDDGWLDASQWLLENFIGFMPVPIFITEPALDNGLGMAGLFVHSPKSDQMRAEDGDNLILPNMSAVAAAYTGNDSWFVGGGHFRNWSKDRYRYNVSGGYASINLDWYGTEEYPLPGSGLRFNAEGAMLDQEFLFRLGESRWYLGAGWRAFSSDVQFITKLPIDLPTVENTVSGLSAKALYENLDFRLSPRRGLRANFSATANRDAIGSDFDFEQFDWKIRQYFEFGEKYTFSWRLDGSTTSGDVPFYLEPYVDIQGIPVLRYQGPTAATVEVRGGYDVHPRWTVLAFVGGGRAADSISDLTSATTRSSYGAGFRYLMAKVLGMRVGLDVARGPEGTYWYLVMGSAWNGAGF